jgi:uncharacterized protein YxjI
MNVAIEQRKFSLRSEYDILTPGCTYYAEKKFFSFQDKIRLLAPDERVLARVSGRFSWFRSKHDIELSDGSVYQFWCEKIWKGVFVCTNGKESYRLYQHKGCNYSIFQNDSQVAAFTKNRVKIGKGDQYEIRVNDDTNVILVICLVLTIDAEEYEDDNASVTFDLGSIGPEDRPFDKSWQPS